MKIKSITYILILLFLASCNAQDKKQNLLKNKKTTEMTTETFDIEKFEKNKVNGEYNFILEDSSRVRQLGSNNYYEEIITLPKPSLFEIYKKYYKSGKLYLFFISFPNDFLISKKEYDKTGKLIEEIDYDIPFKFTFEQLLELLKKEKDSIDIFDRNTVITRGVIDEGTIWEVEWKKTFGRRETIKINGITGEVLERSFYPMEDN